VKDAVHEIALACCGNFLG